MITPQQAQNMKPAKVLFIVSIANCPRTYKMGSELVNENYDVTILEWDRSATLPSREENKKLHVKRMKCRAPYGQAMVIFLPFWWFYISIFMTFNKFNIVQPQNLDNLIPSILLSKLKEFKIVYDIADFYADSYISSNLVSLQKFVRWLECLMISKVSWTIIVDKSRQKQAGGWLTRFSIIYNSPPDTFDASNYVVAATSKADFTLFYGGTLGKDRGLTFMVDAVQDLSNVELIIAGFGYLEVIFAKIITNKKNVEFLGRVPYHKIIELTYSSDCILALYDTSVPNNKLASPNKLFEAMMCAKPIIVTEDTSMAHIVLSGNCGLAVPYGDIKALRTAINTLKNNPDYAAELGKNGRTAYLKEYDWGIMSKRLLAIYDDLLY
jgi:glycosyltransferase involved in cell wall biosynthesis